MVNLPEYLVYRQKHCKHEFFTVRYVDKVEEVCIFCEKVKELEEAEDD